MKQERLFIRVSKKEKAAIKKAAKVAKVTVSAFLLSAVEDKIFSMFLKFNDKVNAGVK